MSLPCASHICPYCKLDVPGASRPRVSRKGLSNKPETLSRKLIALCAHTGRPVSVGCISQCLSLPSRGAGFGTGSAAIPPPVVSRTSGPLEIGAPGIIMGGRDCPIELGVNVAGRVRGLKELASLAIARLLFGWYESCPPAALLPQYRSLGLGIPVLVFRQPEVRKETPIRFMLDYPGGVLPVG